MKILAVEFSSGSRSVAVLEGDTGRTGENAPRVLGSAAQRGNEVTKPLHLVDAALAEAGVGREEVEGIAVGLGPGSYTGIRMAIALAQGWHLGRSVLLAGISSVEAIVAATAISSFAGRVRVVIDAQRQELYWASFLVEAGAWSPLDPLQIISLPDAHTRLSENDSVVGPEAPRWFSHGRTVEPAAEWIGRLALRSGFGTPGELLEPIYLRPVSFVKAPPPRIIP